MGKGPVYWRSITKHASRGKGDQNPLGMRGTLGASILRHNKRGGFFWRSGREGFSGICLGRQSVMRKWLTVRR